MKSTRSSPGHSSRTGSTHAHLAWAGLCALVIANAGCSLFVMAGKMINGDPLTKPAFEDYTGKSMPDEGKKVAVICSAPESIKLEYPSIEADMLGDLTRTLATQKIDIIKPHKVASWIDDNGGVVDDIAELAREVGAEYVIQVRIDNFTYKEENSPTLLRGRSSGSVTVWETDLDDSKSHAQQIFNNGFSSVYPNHQPRSDTEVTPSAFRKKFLTDITRDVGQNFYKYRIGSDF
jgi:hypothetical protein